MQQPDLRQQALECLRRTFGYDSFRLNQAAIIDTLAGGGDALALMPTGGGKSLCYQVPALLRPGTGIVISPLIALMQDQVDSLQQLGIAAAYLNSSLTPTQQQQVEQQLLAGELKLLYIAPERLLAPRTLQLVADAELALFAIDEAHCVSQWGHDFRKEYQQLSMLSERFPGVPRIALTATADRRTRQEIIAQLNLEQAAHFINSFDRPNIRYQIHEGGGGRDALWRFIEREHPNDAGIVYCLSRKKVEEVAAWLQQKGRDALPYHAGLNAETRQQHQARFLREEGQIIVATIAFGMGIDKPDVRFVAHLNLPKSIEAYYQETGRAGRDGQPANAWMHYGLQDVITLRQFNLAADADRQHKQVTHHKLEAMLGLCDLTDCRRQALLAYFDEQLEQPCGNCDNCLTPPETWDATQAAQKALSCVYRTGQRFGVNYLVDVLLGKADERMERFGHHQVSTFGIGGELNATQWRNLYRQLISRGLLQLDPEGHGALQLTDQSRPLLRGETSLQLRHARKAEKSSAKKRDAQVPVQHQPLFEALRQLRASIAQEQGVPPYIIFHDNTLLEMCQQRPATPHALQFISGVGQKKLERYGRPFLDKISEYPLTQLLDNRLSDTVNQTLCLFEQGLSVSAIAEQRNLQSSTVYGHLAEAIGIGLLDAQSVTGLSDNQYRTLANTLELAGGTGLREIHANLEGAYEYDVLRCVAASLGTSRSI